MKKLREYLKVSNPWWEGGHLPQELGFEHKRHIFEDFKAQCLDMKVRRTTLLLGQRRVGKTVMLKQLLGEAIRDGTFVPGNVCYVSMDSPHLERSGPTDVVGEFKLGIDRSKPALVVFDEIQFADDWERHLKVLTDSEAGIRFVVSGSAASALARRSEETGMGRFIRAYLPPVLFCEFLEFKSMWPKSLSKAAADALKDRLKEDEVLALNDALFEYLNHGAYPEPLFDPDVATDKFLMMNPPGEDYFGKFAALHGISGTAGLNALFNYLVEHSGQELSQQKISQDSGISINTIIKYLEFLEATYLVKRVDRIGSELRQLQRSSGRKYILVNSTMHRLYRGEISIDDEEDDIGHIIESAVLAQHHPPTGIARQLSDSAIRYCRFSENRTTYEVDAVHYSIRPGITRLCEIKWSDDRNLHSKSHNNLQFVEKRCKRENKLAREYIGSYCTTKTMYSKHDDSRVTYLPTSQYCVVLGLESLGKVDNKPSPADPGQSSLEL